ncbi:family 16 glycosylhydrolase [Kineococcus sp. GCM10028916]|uniref:glycoside hydrolase family 16 protein n=1 Tax=Kineococcus sp. GCM10028916 TaxID=3273394 RepID=UPI003629D69E
MLGRPSAGPTARTAWSDPSPLRPLGPSPRRRAWQRIGVALVALGLASGVLHGDAPSPPRGGHPSGASAPLGDADWRLTMLDDFTGSTLDPARWSTYTGRPVGQPLTWWRPANVDVTGGVLQLSTTRQRDGVWHGGGISSAAEGGQAYGKWSVRFRAQSAPGVGYAVLLYPTGGAWPPEVDIAEDGGGDRDGYRSTLHYDADNKTITRLLTGVDLSTWHTVSVVLQPGRITYLVDEREWAVVETAHVPGVPMWLGIQTAANECTETGSSCVTDATPDTSTLEVDWVARYSHRDGLTRSAQSR